MSHTPVALHQCHDDWGDLTVREDAGRRMLCFGDSVEQSCVDMLKPQRLCHAYTRAMMLGFLLHPEVRHCTLLGLGAGALARAILTHQPGCRIDAVEMRPRVVDLAREWFGLPQDPRLRLHLMDAWEYLNRRPATSDLVLLDLYLPDGMNQLQARQHFLAACRAILRPGGILVCNYWIKSRLTHHALNESLQAVFGDAVMTLGIPDGNCVAFAFDGGLPPLREKGFLQAAETLGRQMEIPLQRQARALLHENRQTIRLARRDQK
ncbi:MAG: methyltransferase domain-containing protein [Sedimenticola sp.]|nr:methyltransferase domain-containing protein [Sedimenticola sp.]